MSPLEKPQINPSPEGLVRLHLMVNVVLGNMTGSGPGSPSRPANSS
jgi:hypothetical protein